MTACYRQKIIKWLKVFVEKSAQKYKTSQISLFRKLAWESNKPLFHYRILRAYEIIIHRIKRQWVYIGILKQQARTEMDWPWKQQSESQLSWSHNSMGKINYGHWQGWASTEIFGRIQLTKWIAQDSHNAKYFLKYIKA